MLFNVQYSDFKKKLWSVLFRLSGYSFKKEEEEEETQSACS